jgi:L-amino acid N-acyltransferase YncA
MIGMIAFEQATPLGAAHAALLDERTAELAIVVARGERHHGVGAALLDALVAELKRRRYQRLIACALRENTPFGTLAKRAGFTVDEAEGATLRWVLSLTARETAASS